MATYDQAADVNGDGRIDFLDILLVAHHFGARKGDPRYLAVCDVNGNGMIDIGDIGRVVLHLGAVDTNRPADPVIWDAVVPANGTFTPAGLPSEPFVPDVAFWSVNTTFPVKTLTGFDVVNGGNRSWQVHCDPAMSHDGSLNGCARFALVGGGLIECQPLRLSPGGDPSADWVVPEAADQRRGCHGGSGLSMGGTLEPGWSNAPRKRALGCNVDGVRFLNPSPAFVYPAFHADGYALDPGNRGHYQGTGPIHMGSRLALRPQEDLTWITDPKVRVLADAFQQYGAYVCDDTFDWPVFALHKPDNAEWVSNEAELQRVVSLLCVVT